MVVTRKISIPYPTSPPAQQPPTQTQPQPDMSQSHLNLDAADVPPVPATAFRGSPNSTFYDMGNPWQDSYSDPNPKTQTQRVPSILRPGHGTGPLTVKNPTEDVPDFLRPGRPSEPATVNSVDKGKEQEREESPERDWWDDDDEEDYETQKPTTAAESSLPKPQIKRKPIGLQTPTPTRQASSEPAYTSNNPFRRPSESQSFPTQPPPPPQDLPDWGTASQSKLNEPLPHPLRSHPSQDALSTLQVSQPPNQWHPDPPDLVIASPTPPAISSPASQPPPPPTQAPPPIPQLQAPLTPEPTGGSFSQNPWASRSNLASPIPFDQNQKYVTHSTDDLLDREDDQGAIPLKQELGSLPNAAPSPSPQQPQEHSLLDDEEPGPPLPIRTARAESEEMFAPPKGPPPQFQAPPGPPPSFAQSSSPPPPAKPPRPAVVTDVQSDAEYARMLEQRNETYAIKHFDWFDQRSGKMRRSSMLIQNANGPCPLLALVNALILGATEDMQAGLDDALRRREQVTLGLIVETLMDELLSRDVGGVLPEIDELNRFLMRLKTGMNANPRFVSGHAPSLNLMDAESPVSSQPNHSVKAGTFEPSQDLRLYGSFGIPLLHGWLPRPNDEAYTAFARTAQSYEDAQAVQFGEEELEYKLSHTSQGLTADEQRVWEDITSIKQFFRAYPTQLTPYGLGVIHEYLAAGSFAILFRNDHFSTIYRQPRDGRLYTLVTDAGYADRAEIIWESLEDITGARTEYFSGDFKSVSHLPAAADPRASAHNRSQSGDHLTVDTFSTPTGAGPLSPQEVQEQHDADFAMALQLQEEEEQQQRQRRAQQASNSGPDGNAAPSTPAGNPPGRSSPANTSNRPPGPRRSTGNIPIPLRGNSSQIEIRPAMPPRTNRNPAVNRPSDALDEDAPPAYEEAASQPAYRPPMGSPLHPSSSNSLSAQASTSSVNVNPFGQIGQSTGVAPRGRAASENIGGAAAAQMGHNRRTSAYGENSNAWGATPEYYPMAPSLSGRNRRSQAAAGGNDDRDCRIM